jgi:cysteine synthase A
MPAPADAATTANAPAPAPAATTAPASAVAHAATPAATSAAFQAATPPSAPVPVGAPATCAPTATPARVNDEEAEACVRDAIASGPVVLFALEWCEFSWTVRKLFARMGVPYRSVDIDSVEFQRDDMGTRIRPVLKARTGAATIPQIFVGGTHIGGATDVFDAMRSGRLQALLDQAGVDYDRTVRVDPAELLPKWLHPRKAA